MNIKKIIIVISVLFSLTVPALAQDIFNAAWHGDLETVKKLLEEDPGLVNAKSEYERFALDMAAQTGRTAIVKLLLEKGAAANASTKSGYTALHGAATHGGEIEIVNPYSPY